MTGAPVRRRGQRCDDRLSGKRQLRGWARCMAGCGSRCGIYSGIQGVRSRHGLKASYGLARARAAAGGTDRTVAVRKGERLMLTTGPGLDGRDRRGPTVARLARSRWMERWVHRQAEAV